MQQSASHPPPNENNTICLSCVERSDVTLRTSIKLSVRSAQLIRGSKQHTLHIMFGIDFIAIAIVQIVLYYACQARFIYFLRMQK